MHAQVALLDGGAVLTAFDPDGDAADRRAIARARARPSRRSRLAPTLDRRAARRARGRQRARDRRRPDGARHALRADDEHRWTADAPRRQRSRSRSTRRSLSRLADGSVLVLGGRTPTATAWIYRPSLVGPHVGHRSSSLADGSSRGRADRARSGARVDARATARAHAADDDLARARSSGAAHGDRLGHRDRARHAGGVALIAQQTGPGQALVGRARPGRAGADRPRRRRRPRTLCTRQAGHRRRALVPRSRCRSRGIASRRVGARVVGADARSRCDRRRRRARRVGHRGGRRGCAQVDVGPVTVARALTRDTVGTMLRRACVVAAIVLARAASTPAHAYEFWLRAQHDRSGVSAARVPAGRSRSVPRPPPLSRRCSRCASSTSATSRRAAGARGCPIAACASSWQSYLRIDHDFGDFTSGRDHAARAGAPRRDRRRSPSSPSRSRRST